MKAYMMGKAYKKLVVVSDYCRARIVTNRHRPKAGEWYNKPFENPCYGAHGIVLFWF